MNQVYKSGEGNLATGYFRAFWRFSEQAPVVSRYGVTFRKSAPELPGDPELQH